MRLQWDNPEYQREQSAIMKARWRDPAYWRRQSERWLGDNNPGWREGASRDSHPPEFSEALKQSVRGRDAFMCVLCGEEQAGEALCVHHIDGNKQNNAMANLISLHRSCHIKVHKRGDFDAYRIGFQALFADSSPIGAIFEIS